MKAKDKSKLVGNGIPLVGMDGSSNDETLTKKKSKKATTASKKLTKVVKGVIPTGEVSVVGMDAMTNVVVPSREGKKDLVSDLSKAMSTMSEETPTSDKDTKELSYSEPVVKPTKGKKKTSKKVVATEKEGTPSKESNTSKEEVKEMSSMVAMEENITTTESIKDPITFEGSDKVSELKEASKVQDVKEEPKVKEPKVLSEAELFRGVDGDDEKHKENVARIQELFDFMKYADPHILLGELVRTNTSNSLLPSYYHRVMRMKPGDRNFIEEFNDKMMNAGKLKDPLMRLKTPGKDGTLVFSVEQSYNEMENGGRASLLDLPITEEDKAFEKHELEVQINKAVGVKALSKEPVLVRVRDRLDNNSRLVSLGPARGIVPLSQRLRPRSHKLMLSLLLKMKGDMMLVCITKPGVYDTPFYASHRELHPKLLHPIIREAIAFSKKFKKIARSFDAHTLRAFFVMTQSTYLKKKSQEKRLSKRTYMDLMVIVGEAYLKIYSNTSRALRAEKEAIKPLRDNLVETLDYLNPRDMKAMVHYINDYIFANDVVKQQMLDTGVEAYEYREDLGSDILPDQSITLKKPLDFYIKSLNSLVRVLPKVKKINKEKLEKKGKKRTTSRRRKKGSSIKPSPRKEMVMKQEVPKLMITKLISYKKRGSKKM